VGPHALADERIATPARVLFFVPLRRLPGGWLEENLHEEVPLGDLAKRAR
jgi:hypothetical protein